jgi:hypothetical protein
MKEEVKAELNVNEEEKTSSRERVENGKEEMRAHFGSLSSRIDANQERLCTKTDTFEDKLEAKLEACLEKTRVLHERTEGRGFRGKLVHNEVINLDATWAVEDRYRNRHSALRRHRQPKKWPLGSD